MHHVPVIFVKNKLAKTEMFILAAILILNLTGTLLHWLALQMHVVILVVWSHDLIVQNTSRHL